MPGPLRKESRISAPGCKANGSPMMKMSSTNSWGIRWSWICEFSERRSQASGFDEEAIGQVLCIPGQDFARSVTGRRVRIMRTSMTTLTQIWMTLLLSNILPSDHNFDLSLPKCQLVYAIMT